MPWKSSYCLQYKSHFSLHGIQGLLHTILTLSFFSNPLQAVQPPYTIHPLCQQTIAVPYCCPSCSYSCAFAYGSLSSWNVHSSASVWKSNLSFKIQTQYHDFHEKFPPLSPNRMKYSSLWSSATAFYFHLFMNLILYLLINNSLIFLYPSWGDCKFLEYHNNITVPQYLAK